VQRGRRGQPVRRVGRQGRRRYRLWRSCMVISGCLLSHRRRIRIRPVDILLIRIRMGQQIRMGNLRDEVGWMGLGRDGRTS
ncbi:hypothetical protein FRC15_007270, partial [Serendipita sp. 397]